MWIHGASRRGEKFFVPTYLESALAICLIIYLFLALPAHAQVNARVFQVDVKTTEEHVVKVKVYGKVSNQLPLTIRGVTISINLLDSNDQLVRNFTLPALPHMRPQETQPFTLEKVIREYDRSYLKAEASVNYDRTSYLQIADWVLGQNLEKLRLWYLPVDEVTLQHERSRVDTALMYLTYVPAGTQEYKEAWEKRNLIQYNYGIQLSEANDLHEAMLRLSNVEKGTFIYPNASDMLEKLRMRTIYERAMKKAVQGNIRGALRQMLYVSKGSPYWSKAQAKIKDWTDILKSNHISLYAITPPWYLKPDQRKVWMRMQYGPEGTTTNYRNADTFTTWWYLDYSFFTFNKKGQLVNSRIYP